MRLDFLVKLKVQTVIMEVAQLSDNVWLRPECVKALAY